jgi:hypothetical protein
MMTQEAYHAFIRMNFSLEQGKSKDLFIEKFIVGGL